MAVALVNSWQDWACPQCKKTAQSLPKSPNQSLMHDCPKLYGISTPMVRAGIKAKIESVIRPDYVGKEHVTYDSRGKPVMSVVTTRDNGYDTGVFVPRASTDVDVPSSKRPRLAFLQRALRR